MREAFALAAAYDAPTGETTPERGYNRGLVFPVVSREVEHDPVVRAADPVRERCVGKEGRVVAVSARGVQDGKPALPPRIEASRRNHRQDSRLGCLTVLAVYIEQLGD